MPDAPHFTHPVAFQAAPDGTVSIAVTEQGSADDTRSCVARVASFKIGTRDELPEFGITPLVFQRGDLRVDVLRAQLERWVDADLDAQELIDLAAAQFRKVHVAALADGQGA